MEQAIDEKLLDTGCFYKTPYIYGFSLGKDAEKTEDNKYVVYYLGERMEIENKNVDFTSGHDGFMNPIKLTKDEFYAAINGTKGVISIRGEFADNLDKIVEDVLKDYKPYIEYIGNGLYRINGDNNFYYITNEAGAKEADKALRDLVNEKYGFRK